MKSTFILLALMSSLILNTATLASDKKFDGYYWEKINNSQKHFYVLGYIQGLSQYDYILIDFMAILKHENYNKFNKECFEKCPAIIDHQVTLGMCTLLSRTDHRQIIEGIDSLYADYKNKKYWLDLQ